jgi:hypothetical protein
VLDPRTFNNLGFVYSQIKKEKEKRKKREMKFNHITHTTTPLPLMQETFSSFV